MLLAAAEDTNVVVEEQDLLGIEKAQTRQIIEIPSELPPQQFSDLLDNNAQELTPQQLWHAHLDGGLDQAIPKIPPITIDPTSILINSEDTRLAYVLSLPNPSDLCSALLFTKQHRESSIYPASQFNIIYLYPHSWETSTKQVHRDALSLLIQAEHTHSVLLHPVQISKVWSGIDVESQLLSELARNPWIYDRVMYLRLPGILVDTGRLDNTLVSSYLTPKIVKEQWTKLRAPVRRGAAAAEALRPDVLLFAQGRGLMVPTSEDAKSVTARATQNPEERQIGQIEEESLDKDAAFVLFEEDMLKRRRTSGDNPDDLFARFERERQRVCEGTLLLS